MQYSAQALSLLVKTYPRDTEWESERYRRFLSNEDIRFKPDAHGENPLTRALYEQVVDEKFERTDMIKQHINQAMSDLQALYQKNPVAAQIVVNQADDEGDTALVYCANFGMFDLFERLFMFGANPYLETKRRSLFLLFNTQKKLPKLNLAENAMQYLHAMKKYYHSDIALELNRIKITYPNDPSRQHERIQHEGILHKALTCHPVIDGIGNVIHQLLEYGADPNQINTQGQTPLFLLEPLPFEECNAFLRLLIHKTRQEDVKRYLNTEMKKTTSQIYGRIRALYNEIYRPAEQHYTQQKPTGISQLISKKSEGSILLLVSPSVTRTRNVSQAASIQSRLPTVLQTIRPSMTSPLPSDALASSPFSSSLSLPHSVHLPTQPIRSGTVKPYSQTTATTTGVASVSVTDALTIETSLVTGIQSPLLSSALLLPQCSYRVASATAVRESDTAGPVIREMRPQAAVIQEDPMPIFVSSASMSQAVLPVSTESFALTTITDEPFDLPSITTLPRIATKPSSQEIPFFLRPGRYPDLDMEESTPLIRAIINAYARGFTLYNPVEKIVETNIFSLLNKMMKWLEAFADQYPSEAKHYINFSDSDDVTALNCAASMGLTHLYKPLINAGADIGLEKTSTSFHHALTITEEKQGRTNFACLDKLIKAIKESGKFSDDQLTKQLNIKSRQTFHEKIICRTALHKALCQPYEHHKHIIGLLLQHGADPNMTDQDNNTALDHALQLLLPGSREILTMIASKTSTPNINKCIERIHDSSKIHLLREHLHTRQSQVTLATTKQPPAPTVFIGTTEAEPVQDWDLTFAMSPQTSIPFQITAIPPDLMFEPVTSATTSHEINMQSAEDQSLLPLISSPDQIDIPEDLGKGESRSELHESIESLPEIPSVVMARPSTTPKQSSMTGQKEPSDSETTPSAQTGCALSQDQPSAQRSAYPVEQQSKQDDSEQLPVAATIRKNRKRASSTQSGRAKVRK